MDPSLSNLILETADKFVSTDKDITITQALLLAAKQFLTDRKFQLCRKAAVEAQTYEPDIPGVSQILAVANTLMAADAETPISENLPDCYAILEVPRYSDDFLEIKDQYKKLCLLLDPNETLPGEDEVPLAREAFSYVNKAWYELSVKSRKSQYDGSLLKFIQESGPKPPRKPINRSEEEESKPPIKSRRSKRRSGLKMRANGKCVFCTASFVARGNHLVCWNCGELLRDVAVKCLGRGRIISDELLNEATGVLKEELKTEEEDLVLLKTEENPKLFVVRFKNEIVDEFDLNAVEEVIEDDDNDDTSKKKMRFDLDVEASIAKENVRGDHACGSRIVKKNKNDDKELKAEDPPVAGENENVQGRFDCLDAVQAYDDENVVEEDAGEECVAGEGNADGEK